MFSNSQVVLTLTGVLILGFSSIMGIEYQEDWHEHLVPGFGFLFSRSPEQGPELFFYLYFALTGLHALHLTIGVVAVLLSLCS